jgi:hypothetical protein
MIALMRFVSEGGILYVHTSFRPLDIISQFAGTSRISPASLTNIAASEMVFMTTIQDFLMLSVMDVFKLSDIGKLRRRSLLKVMVGSILVSIGVSYVSILVIAYKYGAVNLGGVLIWPGRLAYDRLQIPLLITPESPNQMGVFYLAIGAGTILFLGFMRQRFLWWPFHPLGYAMGATWPMVRLWFVSFLGWFFKWLTLKYSGVTMYRKLRTLFFGMVLGEYLSSGFWLIIDFITHRSGHALFLAG